MKKLLLFILTVAFFATVQGQGVNVLHTSHHPIIVPESDSYPSVLDDGNTIGWYVMDSVMYNGADSAVTAWNDKSSAGNDLSQYLGASKYYGDSVYHSQSTSYLRATSLVGGAKNQPFTIYIAMRILTYGDYGDVFNLLDATNLSIRSRSTPGLIMTLDAVNSSVLSTANDWMVVIAHFNGASSDLAIDQGTPVTGNAGTDQGSVINFKPSNLGSSHEMIIRNVDDGSTDETAIYNYLANKISGF